jgi:hypothetical protein
MNTYFLWDVRTTDLWVHQLDSSGNPIKSWNILQGQTPVIPQGEQIRIDARLQNFSSNGVSVSFRLVGQTIGKVTGNLGLVIYTPFTGLMAPGQDSVRSLFMPMWSENVYQRLWVDNENGTLGNCTAGTPPPWRDDVCRQGELYDFALSSRHLVECDVSTPQQPPPTDNQKYSILFSVKDKNSGTGIPNAQVASPLGSATSDTLGFASLVLPKGLISITVNAAGYQPFVDTFNITGPMIIPIQMQPTSSGTTGGTTTGGTTTGGTTTGGTTTGGTTTGGTTTGGTNEPVSAQVMIGIVVVAIVIIGLVFYFGSG